MTPAHLGLMPNTSARVAEPGPPATTVRDEAPGFDVLDDPEILQRIPRRHGVLGTCTAPVLLPVVLAPAPVSYAPARHRRPADGVERGVLAVPGAAASAGAGAGPRSFAGQPAPTDGEV